MATSADNSGPRSETLKKEISVLRIKRKRSTDPAEALFVSTKKVKLLSSSASSPQPESGDGEDDDKDDVYLFACTVDKKHSNRSMKSLLTTALDRQKLYKRHGLISSVSEIRSSLHGDKTQSAKVNRFRVVSAGRLGAHFESDPNQDPKPDEATTATGGLKKLPEVKPAPVADVKSISPTDEPALSDDDDDDVQQLFHIYDVIRNLDGMQGHNENASSKKPKRASEITCNSVKMIREQLKKTNLDHSLTIGDSSTEDESTDDEFLTDIYTCERVGGEFQDMVDISSYTGNVVDDLIDDVDLGDDRDDVWPGPLATDQCYDDEDDSNDECNWRNDYPDRNPDSDGVCVSDNNDDDDYFGQQWRPLDYQDMRHTYDSD